MTREELRQYAQVGAEARLEQLHREIDTIHKMFPELRSRRGGKGAEPSDGNRPRMSAAQRKAVSARMTAYWAKRRGDKPADASQPTASPSKRRTMSPEARQRIAEAQRKRWAERKAKDQGNPSKEKALRATAAARKKR